MRSRKVNVKVALKVLPILLLNIRVLLVTVLNFIVDIIIIAILFIAILFLIRLDPLAAMFEQLLVPQVILLLMMMIIAPHKVVPVNETRSTHTRSSAGCHLLPRLRRLNGYPEPAGHSPPESCRARSSFE